MKRLFLFYILIFYSTILRASSDIYYEYINSSFKFSNNDTLIKEIYLSTLKVSSKNYFSDDNYKIIEIELPENCVSWTYYIGTGSEVKAEIEKTKNNITSKASIIVDKLAGSGLMSEIIKGGISYVNNVKVADNVKYWLISNSASIELFKSKQTFSCFKKGDVVFDSHLMKSPNSGKIYIAILNDNLIDSIDVTVKVISVQVK